MRKLLFFVIVIEQLLPFHYCSSGKERRKQAFRLKNYLSSLLAFLAVLIPPNLGFVLLLNYSRICTLISLKIICQVIYLAHEFNNFQQYLFFKYCMLDFF